MGSNYPSSDKSKTSETKSLESCASTRQHDLDFAFCPFAQTSLSSTPFLDALSRNNVGRRPHDLLEIEAVYELFGTLLSDTALLKK